jgi:hypothetical protein
MDSTSQRKNPDYAQDLFRRDFDGNWFPDDLCHGQENRQAGTVSKAKQSVRLMARARMGQRRPRRLKRGG